MPEQSNECPCAYCVQDREARITPSPSTTRHSDPTGRVPRAYLDPSPDTSCIWPIMVWDSETGYEYRLRRPLEASNRPEDFAHLWARNFANKRYWFTTYSQRPDNYADYLCDDGYYNYPEIVDLVLNRPTRKVGYFGIVNTYYSRNVVDYLRDRTAINYWVMWLSDESIAKMQASENNHYCFHAIDRDQECYDRLRITRSPDESLFLPKPDNCRCMFCEHERRWEENAVENNRYSRSHNLSYRQRCNGYRYICYDCGAPGQYSFHSTGDDSYCEDCTRENFVECDRCEGWYEPDDIVEPYTPEMVRPSGPDWYSSGSQRPAMPEYHRLCESCHDYVQDDDDDDGSAYGSAYGIRNYSYRPSPMFGEAVDDTVIESRGDIASKRYFGVELETHSGHCDWNALLGDWAYAKHDGSIAGPRGAEIVTHPMTFEAHRVWWTEYFSRVRSTDGADSIRSWTGSCGMHVHINRESVSQRLLAKLILFVNSNKTDRLVRSISGRTISQMRQWSMKEHKTPSEVENQIRYGSARYEAVNLCPHNTYEIRLFRGNHKLDAVLRNIQFVESTLRYLDTVTRDYTDSPDEYCDYVIANRETYPELAQFLTNRGFVPVQRSIEGV